MSLILVHSIDKRNLGAETMAIWMPILMVGVFTAIVIPMIFLNAYMRQKRLQQQQANMAAGMAMTVPPPQPMMQPMEMYPQPGVYQPNPPMYNNQQPMYVNQPPMYQNQMNMTPQPMAGGAYGQVQPMMYQM